MVHCTKVYSAKVINLYQQVKYNKGQWSRAVHNSANGQDPCIFFVPPGPLIQDLNKNIALVRIRFVGDGSTAHCPQKSNASYEKIYVGIDISKEKLNLCYQIELKTAREEEVENS